jgi:23S rRNA (cytidine1920-2'-O)/16S rRNA (cytidine1409-2'-O)-methyltransferase
MEGRVSAGLNKIYKPGDLLTEDSEIKIKPLKKYVSRGGYKIEGAFNDFKLDAKGIKALDIGSSTGGFTDFLIKSGARKVTAVDVGYGLLSWNLRNLKNIEILERTNIRHLDTSLLKYKADLAVVDVSFISIEKIFKKILEATSSDAVILLLLKPQFELDRKDVKNRGVVKDKSLHIKSINKIIEFFKNFQVIIEGISFSKIKGYRGNIEFWVYLRKSVNSTEYNLNCDKIIDEVVNKAHDYLKEK